MANNSSLSKRAALRQQQEMEERNKRTRRILAVGAGLVAVTVVAVLAIVIMQALAKRAPVTAEQLTPPNATEASGILLSGKAPQGGTPHLVVWEDFQCPACASREASYGPVIEQLVADGTISGGMIPKVETCFDALKRGVDAAVIVNGKAAHAVLLEIFTETGAGTLIRR